MASLSRTLRRALALAVLIAAAVPTLAHATVTESTITSPAKPTYLLFEPAPTLAAETLTVVATTDGAAKDQVDVICTFGDDYARIAEDLELVAGGTLDAEVSLAGFPVHLCDLRVVPAGYAAPDLSPFTGPVVAASTYYPDHSSAPVRGAKRTAILDYVVETGHQRGAAAIVTAGGGGVSAAVGVKAGAHEPFGYPTWHDGAGIADLVVDGRVAYTTEDIPRFQYGTEQSMTPAGFEGLQATPALDPSTGAMTISESQRIFRCEGDDDGRPTEEECRSVIDTGIRLDRTISLTREHSIADVRDRWVSSDGLAHQVRARYTADLPPARRKAEGPQWRFPGDPAFKFYAAGDVIPQGPGTVLVRDADDLRAPGALSFAPAPERFTFDDGGALAETAQLAVPAGGAAPVRRVFALGRDAGEAAALGRATEDGFAAPRVEISSVSGAATATVRGRATDNVGVVALSVNGRAAAVAADGSFSVPVALLRGANEISVTATDGAGLSANARVVAQGGAIRGCRVPRIKAGASVKAVRAAIRKAGCKARTRRVSSRTVRKGRVVGLSRKAGTLVPRGTAIRIRVSAGRRR